MTEYGRLKTIGANLDDLCGDVEVDFESLKLDFSDRFGIDFDSERGELYGHFLDDYVHINEERYDYLTANMPLETDYSDFGKILIASFIFSIPSNILGAVIFIGSLSYIKLESYNEWRKKRGLYDPWEIKEMKPEDYNKAMDVVREYKKKALIKEYSLKFNKNS